MINNSRVSFNIINSSSSSSSMSMSSMSIIVNSMIVAVYLSGCPARTPGGGPCDGFQPGPAGGCIYVRMYVCMYVCMNIYIYIYIERERDR